MFQGTPKLSKICIPEEKDLIDNEFEVECEDMASPEPEILELERLSSPSTQAQPKSKKKQKPKKSVGAKKMKPNNDERELMAKVKREEMQQMAKEVSLNKSLVAFLDMCVFTNQLNRGLQTLNYYRNRSKKFPTHPPVTDINAFNCLLHGFAAKVLF